MCSGSRADDAEPWVGYRYRLTESDGDIFIVGMISAVGRVCADNAGGCFNIHLVYGAGGVIGFARYDCARVSGNAGKVKIIANPVRNGIGIHAIRDAGSPTRSEIKTIIGNTKHRRRVGAVTCAAVINSHAVRDFGPKSDIYHAIIIGIDITADNGGVIFDQQEADRAIFKGIRSQIDEVKTVRVGGSERDDIVHKAFVAGGRVEIAFNPKQGVSAVVCVGAAKELDILHVGANGVG